MRFCKTDLSTPCPYDNAFWNGQQATFGQGFARADDVVAHELTHGVIEHTANLFFWYQSGAINESMADVFGEFVDQTDAMGDDSAGVKWQVGEDLAGPSPLRSMSNPRCLRRPGPDDQQRCTPPTPPAPTAAGSTPTAGSATGPRC